MLAWLSLPVKSRIIAQLGCSRTQSCHVATSIFTCHRDLDGGEVRYDRLHADIGPCGRPSPPRGTDMLAAVGHVRPQDAAAFLCPPGLRHVIAASNVAAADMPRRPHACPPPPPSVRAYRRYRLGASLSSHTSSM